jgi:hypothetical protein
VFKDNSDWFFKKDTNELAPFMTIIEKARFDEIMAFYIDFSDLIIFPEEKEPMKSSNGKNIFHRLFLNKDDTAQSLLTTLK